MAKKTTAKPKENKADGNVHQDIYTLVREHLGEDEDPSICHWLPTGCTLLDMAINNGLPGGKIIEVFGESASAKSGLALSFVRQAQLAGGTGIWIDTESALSWSMAQDIMGVRLDAGWSYRRANIAEEVLDTIDAIATRAAQSVLPTVIVVDSVAGLCPKTLSLGEEEMSGKRQTGKTAALLSWWFSRGILRTIAGSNVYLVFINQIRSVLDFYGSRFRGPRYTTPGGHSIAFYSSIRIHLTQESIEPESTKSKNPIGVMVRANIEKNRVGIPYRSVRFPFYFRPDQPILGIDDTMSMLIYLFARKAFAQSGSWYTLGNRKMQKMKWHEAILTDADLQEEILNLTRETFMEEHGMVPAKAQE